MALAEIAFTRIHCGECRNRQRMEEGGVLVLAYQGGSRCRCRIVTDFYVGRALFVMAEMAVAQAALSGVPFTDPFDGY